MSTPEMFSRRVVVDRGLTPDQVLDNTGRVRGYIDAAVLATMPGVGVGPEKVEVWFFELGYDPTPAELAKEYEFRELRADCAALAQAITDEPGLADKRPVVCQWGLGRDGTASYSMFYRWRDERWVHVRRFVSRWRRFCLFAGVRKQSLGLVPCLVDLGAWPY